jgi:cytochrome c-type biogenesis protein CcmH
VKRRVPWPELALAALCAAAAAALVVAAGSSSESSGTVEQRAHALASTLKCPVCHDLSAADSPAPVAQQMRAQIAEELRAGRTPDQIRAEFVASYGEWILLSPPQRGLDLLPWLAPAFLGFAGLVVTVLAIRGWTSGRRTEGTSPAETVEADRHLVANALASLEADLE